MNRNPADGSAHNADDIGRGGGGTVESSLSDLENFVGKGGYPHIAEYTTGQTVEIVEGALRQQTPVSVVITSVGTTAKVTHVGHDYVEGDKIHIFGADQRYYNGIFTISGVGVDTYQYTMQTSQTSPATGDTKTFCPARWYWIKDAFHEPVGVDDSTPYVVATGSIIPIPYSKTYSKVISFVAGPDETLANTLNLSVGGSVGLDLAQLKMNANLDLCVDVYYDGTQWVTVAGAGQGASGVPVSIKDIAYSSGTLTLSTDFIGGKKISVCGNSRGGAIIPFEPVLRVSGVVTNSHFTSFNFKDSASTLYTDVPTNRMSLTFTKSYTSGAFADGSDGSGSSYKFFNGNIWFKGEFLL